MKTGNKNFIFTKDKKTADKLLALGFIEIPAGTDGYKFVNCQKINFSDEDFNLKDCVFTDTFFG